MEENKETLLKNTPQLENRTSFCIYQDIESFTPKTPVTKTDIFQEQVDKQNIALSDEFFDEDGILDDNVKPQLQPQIDGMYEEKENINPFTKKRVVFHKKNVNSSMPLRDITHIYQKNCINSQSIQQESCADESKTKLKTTKVR